MSKTTEPQIHGGWQNFTPGVRLKGMPKPSCGPSVDVNSRCRKFPLYFFPSGYLYPEDCFWSAEVSPAESLDHPTPDFWLVSLCLSFIHSLMALRGLHVPGSMQGCGKTVSVMDLTVSLFRAYRCTGIWSVSEDKITGTPLLLFPLKSQKVPQKGLLKCLLNKIIKRYILILVLI